MAFDKKSAGTAKPAPKAEAPARMTLDEFCMRLSVKDRRVEMISGFHSQERAARRVVDTEANFASRYEAFTKLPA